MGFPKTQQIVSRIKEHGILLLIFVLLVLGIVIWKLSGMNEGYLDAGLAEIRAQVMASEFKKQTPPQSNSCPLSSGSQPPCFLGIKDLATAPKPETPRPRHTQFPKCIRCEEIINRPVSIAPSNGNFGLGHFLAKKKDNNSIVIVPEAIGNSSVRRATDGSFRLILGLADSINGVTIYHPETDSVIARDANGKVKLAPIDDFAGALAPAATFLLMDGIANYSAVSFKCMPINQENQDRYLGFLSGAIPGGSPLQVLTAEQITQNSSSKQKQPLTFDFDILDIETNVPVIMNKHSGLPCTGGKTTEGFWDGDGNIDLREKREVGSFVLAGEIDSSELTKTEVLGGLADKPKVLGYIPKPENGIYPVSLNTLVPSIQQNKKQATNISPNDDNYFPLGGIPDRPFLTANSNTKKNKQVENFLILNNLEEYLNRLQGRQSAANNSGANFTLTDPNASMPAANNSNLESDDYKTSKELSLETISQPPKNLFGPGYGMAFNNVLNDANQKYKDQLSDDVFNKLNAAKLNPSVQNILDYNAAAYKIFNNENTNFDKKIDTQNKNNSSRLNNLISNLDSQRIQSMSRDLFFYENQMAKNKSKTV